ncbi:hypothetical protein BH10PSE1_BH10PSE1_22600 [soil metagenome]
MSPAADALLAQARHYRQLASMISDAQTHRVLLDMAREHEREARLLEARRDPEDRPASGSGL